MKRFLTILILILLLTPLFSTYQSVTPIKDAIGGSITNRAITATLFVSPNGDDTDGNTLIKAFTTIQGALDVASTDPDDCTLILISPHTTFYDIDTTGDPTWTGNYIIKNTYRLWSPIRNEHASATSVFKFTGKVALVGLAIFTEDAVDGVIFTNSGYRVEDCGFNSEGTSGANTSIHIDGSGAFIRGGVLDHVEIRGHVTHTTGIYMNNAKINETENLSIHACLKGIQIVHNDSDSNTFCNTMIGMCAIGLDLDAGNTQMFEHIDFHGNTTNVDDEVGDHVWSLIHGEFPISFEPDDFIGVAVDTGDGADTWSGLVEVRAAATSTVPFRVTGISLEAGTSEKYRLRLTADGGSTYPIDFQFEGVALGSQSSALTFPSGTEFIFNKGTQIQASSKSESAGVDELDVWLELQEIK